MFEWMDCYHTSFNHHQSLNPTNAFLDFSFLLTFRMRLIPHLYRAGSECIYISLGFFSFVLSVLLTLRIPEKHIVHLKIIVKNTVCDSIYYSVDLIDSRA